jgi:hypothetical protein
VTLGASRVGLAFVVVVAAIADTDTFGFEGGGGDVADVHH